MKIKKIVSGIACMVTLAACNLDYHEYANYGKDYIDESYENVIGMITNVYSILDYDFGQTYKGGMLASACDEAEYAYTNNDICDFVNGSWSPANPMSNIWSSSYKAIHNQNTVKKTCIHEFGTHQFLHSFGLCCTDDVDTWLFYTLWAVILDTCVLQVASAPDGK